jgi:hypothetical protein
MQVMAGGWRRIGGVRHEYESGSLGLLLGEGVVEDQAVHATFAFHDIEFADRNLVRFALPSPIHASHSQTFEFLHHG